MPLWVSTGTLFRASVYACGHFAIHLRKQYPCLHVNLSGSLAEVSRRVWVDRMLWALAFSESWEWAGWLPEPPPPPPLHPPSESPPPSLRVHPPHTPQADAEFALERDIS